MLELVAQLVLKHFLQAPVVMRVDVGQDYQQIRRVIDKSNLPVVLDGKVGGVPGIERVGKSLRLGSFRVRNLRIKAKDGLGFSGNVNIHGFNLPSTNLDWYRFRLYQNKALGRFRQASLKGFVHLVTLPFYISLYLRSNTKNSSTTILTFSPPLGMIIPGGEQR